MEGAGDHPFPLELPDVAEVDEDDVVLAVPRAGLLEAERVRMRDFASSTSCRNPRLSFTAVLLLASCHGRPADGTAGADGEAI